MAINLFRLEQYICFPCLYKSSWLFPVFAVAPSTLFLFGIIPTCLDRLVLRMCSNHSNCLSFTYFKIDSIFSCSLIFNAVKSCLSLHLSKETLSMQVEPYSSWQFSIPYTSTGLNNKLPYLSLLILLIC